MKHNEAPAALLWGADKNLHEGDPRLAMFDIAPDTSKMNKCLTAQCWKILERFRRGTTTLCSLGSERIEQLSCRNYRPSCNADGPDGNTAARSDTEAC